MQDFHPGDPDCLASGGMDNTVKIWCLTGTQWHNIVITCICVFWEIMKIYFKAGL